MVHGTQKLFGFPAPVPDAIPSSAVSVGGISRLLVACFCCLDYSLDPSPSFFQARWLFAYFKIPRTQGFWPLLTTAKVWCFYCFMFFYFASAGGGPWSFDRFLRKRASL